MSSLVEIDDYIKEHLKKKEKMPSNFAKKRQWLKNRGLKTVKHPKTGRHCIPVYEKTLMLKGTRLSATKERQETHETREEARTSYKKISEKMDVATNSKEWHVVRVVLA